MSGLKNNSAFDTFARMEEKVDRQEAEAQAAMELSSEGDDSLDSEFAALSSSDGVQDDALAALKAKMGMAPAPAALPQASGTESVDAVEAELEALLNEPA